MIDKLSYKLLSMMTEREFARFKDLKEVISNPRTLTHKLRQLKSLGLIRKVGGVYKLTEKGYKVAGKLKEVENLIYSEERVSNFERIPHFYYAPVMEKFCKILQNLFGQRLVSVMLFGSIARGDWDKNSDIDVLIVVEGWEGKKVWERIREIREAEKLLEKSTEYAKSVSAGYIPVIQPYPLSVEEAKKFNRVYLDAVLDGIILFDKNCFMENVIEKFRRKLIEIGSKRIVLPNKRFYWVLKDVEQGEVIKI